MEQTTRVIVIRPYYIGKYTWNKVDWIKTSLILGVYWWKMFVCERSELWYGIWEGGDDNYHVCNCCKEHKFFFKISFFLYFLSFLSFAISVSMFLQFFTFLSHGFNFFKSQRTDYFLVCGVNNIQELPRTCLYLELAFRSTLIESLHIFCSS